MESFGLGHPLVRGVGEHARARRPAARAGQYDSVQVVCEVQLGRGGRLPFYDVTPDGRKILLDRVSQQVSQSLTVVTNFREGLRF
ncbi:MAG: hypothetical protein JWO91_3774 [Acidobacteriaceae bacterium]|nr:hypothetical protein [Acidobacteriaceae bacterium]